ncbi:MAG: helix-turn-helix domain-containing protein [Planctomycetota bacterium]|jgi:hypothetical protein
MMPDADRIDILAVASFFNDPFLRIRSQAGLHKIHRLVTEFAHELQDMEGALDCLVGLAREVDADWEAYRDHLTQQARVLDLIEGIRSADDINQAKVIARMALQLDDVVAQMTDQRRATGEGDERVIHPNKLYSRKDAAAVLGVSVSTVDREAKRRHLRTVQVGRRVMFVGGDLLTYRDATDDLKVLGD